MKTKTQRWQTDDEVFNGARRKYRPMFCQQRSLNFALCVSQPNLATAFSGITPMAEIICG